RSLDHQDARLQLLLLIVGSEWPPKGSLLGLRTLGRIEPPAEGSFCPARGDGITRDAVAPKQDRRSGGVGWVERMRDPTPRGRDLNVGSRQERDPTDGCQLDRCQVAPCRR